MRFVKIFLILLLALAIGIPAALPPLVSRFGPGLVRSYLKKNLPDGKASGVKTSLGFSGLRPRLEFSADSFEIPKLKASGIRASWGPDPGTLNIAGIKTPKASLEAIEGRFFVDLPEIRFEPIHARFAGKGLTGSGAVRFGKTVGYRIEVLAGALPAQTLIRAFEWEKKVSMSGVFDGRLKVEGSGKKLTMLEGTFDAAGGGGDIVVLDQAFLQRIADSSKQPIEIVKASFENYHYNDGKVRFFLDRKDLKLNLDLGGEAGKRNLEVNLHDMFPEE
jgi:hypothetical protein